MKSDDPTTGWRDAREFYTVFAARPGWEFLEPMIGLVEWAAGQPFAKRLYPGTSHEHLTVGTVPGYTPELPFFAVCSGGDGLFRYKLYKSVGEKVAANEYPADRSREGFAEFVRLLEASRSDGKKIDPGPN